MASLTRPWVVRYVIPRPGGKPRHVPKGTPGAVRTRGRTRKWYGQGVPGYPRGYKVPLSTDRRAAEKILADLVSRHERGRAGLPRDEPLGPLLDEWAMTIDGNETHRREVLNHARSVCIACGLRTLADLRGRGVVGAVEKYVRSLAAGEAPLAGRTAAAYGAHTRQFTRWLWRKKEALDADPLAGLDLPSQRPKTPRRDLTPDELRKLLEAAAASRVVIKGLAGTDRVMLYLTATYTGFRASELAALTPANFRLDREPPTVWLAGEHTKNGEDAEQPIPAPLARSLQPYLAPLSRQDRVWRGNWFGRAAALLRADLAAAGLPARTEAGEAVFHSLRHTYASMLASVAPVKVAQELSRHADVKTTLEHYTHASDKAKAEAVNLLPLPGALTPASSPFRGMGRGELEDLTLALWVGLTTILGGGR
jgi:integrase